MTVTIASWVLPLILTIISFGYRSYWHHGRYKVPDEQLFTFMFATIISLIGWVGWLTWRVSLLA